MLGVRHLGLIFIAALVLFLLVLMPASLALGWVGLGRVIGYSEAKGSLWHAELKDVSVGGLYLGTLNLEPDAVALFTGSLAGKANFSGGGSSGHFRLEDQSGTMFGFRDGEIVTPVQTSAGGWLLAGTVALKSPQVVIDTQAGCQEGDFTIRTDMLAPALRAFGGDDLMLVGTGHCQAGVVTAVLEGDTGTVTAQIAARWSVGHPMLADVTLLPHDAALSDDLQTALQFAGLKASGAGWQGQLTIPVKF